MSYADQWDNASRPPNTDEELLSFIDGLLMDDEYSLDDIPPMIFYNAQDADNPSNAISYVDLHSVLDGQDIGVIFGDQDSGVVLDYDADSVEDWLAHLPTPPPGAIINIDWPSMFTYEDNGEPASDDAASAATSSSTYLVPNNYSRAHTPTQRFLIDRF